MPIIPEARARDCSAGCLDKGGLPMIVDTSNQAYIFLATVYGGMFLGIVYDLYRAFRMIIKPGRWFVALLDLSFWILAVIISFSMLFRINGGEIRFYTF